MNHTFITIFYIKKDKRSSSKKHPILLRITVDGKRAEVSTKTTIESEKWDSKSGKAKGNRANTRAINEHLSNLSHKVYRIYSELE